MKEPENSYQTARKDALKAAAVIGTIAAGRWAYKKYKKSGGDWEKTAMGCLALIGTLTMLPIFVPFFLYYRKTCVRKAKSSIQLLKTKRAILQADFDSLTQHIESLRLSPQDRTSAQGALDAVGRRIDKIDAKIFTAAEVWATRVYQDVKGLKRRRRWLLEGIRGYPKVDLEKRLRTNSDDLAILQSELCALEKDYGVDAYENFLDAFIENFRGRLIACIVVGVIIFYAAFFSR